MRPRPARGGGAGSFDSRDPPAALGKKARSESLKGHAPRPLFKVACLYGLAPKGIAFQLNWSPAIQSHELERNAHLLQMVRDRFQFFALKRILRIFGFGVFHPSLGFD